MKKQKLEASAPTENPRCITKTITNYEKGITWNGIKLSDEEHTIVLARIKSMRILEGDILKALQSEHFPTNQKPLLVNILAKVFYGGEIVKI